MNSLSNAVSVLIFSQYVQSLLESLNKKSKLRSYLIKLASFQICSKIVPVKKPVSIKLLRNRCFSTGIHEYFTLNPMYTRSRMRTTYSIQSTAPYIPSSFIINKTVFINFTTFYLGTSNTRQILWHCLNFKVGFRAPLL